MDDFEHLDHYAMLGVGRGATADEIKRAYRQQMARYHPDRFVGATPEEQAYASRRALRINAAYAALSDFSERAAYNRTLAGGAPRTPPPPQSPRDHLAELYEQAQAHLAAGRALQAAATLREILQLNPFYKDSGALLAQAEAAAKPQGRAPGAPDQGRRALVAGGLGALALLGLGAVGWSLRGRAAGATQGAAAGSTQAPAGSTSPAGGAAPPTAEPTAAPPTAEPTALPPTAEPTAAPPTAPPTAAPPTPSAVPTPAATATPAPIAEEGPLLYVEDFGPGSSWPTLSGRGWSVGRGDGAYRIVAGAGTGNIWAYSTAPVSDFLVGVDIVANGGLAGLLLRFSEAGYLAFMVNPTLGSYRLASRDGGGEGVLIEEAHPAIAIAPGAVNRLAALLQGEAVALRINGQPVYDLALAAPPPSARYGLVAAGQDAEVTATFTNLTLRGL